MRLLAVTIASPRTQFTSLNLYSPFVIIQNNNASDAVYIGDETVTSSNGIRLTPGGSMTIQRADNRIPLFQYYVAGTAADTVQVLYEQG